MPRKLVVCTLKSRQDTVARLLAGDQKPINYVLDAIIRACKKKRNKEVVK